jgi:hypothetical protein
VEDVQVVILVMERLADQDKHVMTAHVFRKLNSLEKDCFKMLLFVDEIFRTFHKNLRLTFNLNKIFVASLCKSCSI